MSNNLEEEYETLIRSLYDKLRENVELGEIAFYDAEILARMISSRTGVNDMHSYPWNSSSWCYESWDDSNCSF